MGPEGLQERAIRDKRVSALQHVVACDSGGICGILIVVGREREFPFVMCAEILFQEAAELCISSVEAPLRRNNTHMVECDKQREVFVTQFAEHLR